MSKNSKIVLAAVATVVGLLMLVLWSKLNRPNDNHPLAKLSTDPNLINIIVITSSEPLQDILTASVARGVNFVAEEINQGTGVLGKKLNIVELDTQGDSEIAIPLVEEATSLGTVSAIIGGYSRDEILALSKFAETKKIPYLIVSDGQLKTCDPEQRDKLREFTWTTGLTAEMIMEPFLIHVAARFRDPKEPFKLMFFGTKVPEQENALQILKKVVPAMGFNNLGEVLQDPRIKDYHDQIYNVFSLDVNLVLLTIIPENVATFLTQATKLSLQRDLPVAVVFGLPEELATETSPHSDQVITQTRYSHLIDNPENKRLLESWYKKFGVGEHPTALSISGGYTAMRMLIAAWASAKQIDGSKTVAALDSLEMQLPQGRVLVDSRNHTLTQPLYAVDVEKGYYFIKEYLGDVSHPDLQNCIFIEKEK